jgi:hypothetical protein
MIQENDMYQKCFFLSIPHSAKLASKNPTRASEDEAEYVGKLESMLMWSAWGSLKACTQANGKLDVQLCHHEVQDGANHTSIVPLINNLIIFIRI